MALNIDIMGLRRTESMSRADRLLEAALIYARSGARVMPLFPNSKMPALESWSDASSDPAQIRTWFGRGGRHCNGNIAILIDGSFKVIDIDTHGDVDGFKFLAGALDKAACPRAATAGGGEHLLASKTDVKNDPKNGVEVLEEGHLFTVYPSEINGKQYTWRSGGVPSPVQRIRGVEKTPTSASAVAVAPAGYLDGVLEYLDPGCDYTTWLMTGMALHHNDSGEGGLVIWDRWSQGSGKYKPGECDRRWQTFDQNRGKPVGIRWLIMEAVKNGKPITKEDILYHGNLYGSIEIDKINEKFGILDMNGKMFIVYKERGNIHFADAHNFRLKIADVKIEVDGKLKPMADVWLEHPDRRVVTEVGMWEPGSEPADSLNYYEGLAVSPIPCDESEISLFLNFCRDDVCRGNERHYNYLMDMLAAKLQNPLQLMKICLVMRGGEGVGKGALTRVMENIIGPKHSVAVSSANSWLGTFGTFLKNAVWISANEAHWSGNHQHSERLKAIITEESLDIEEKFIHIKNYENHVMVAITSNNRWAVPAGHDSRRYFVLDVSNNRADDPEFWDEFHARMGKDPKTRKLNDPEYLGKILYWMKKRKVKSDLKRAMETSWLMDQRRESAIESREDAFIMWVRQTFVNNGQEEVMTGAGGYTFPRMEKSDGTPVFRTERVYDDYRAYIAKNHKKPRMVLTQSSWVESMEKLGFEAKRVVKDRLTMGGRKPPDATGTGAKVLTMRIPSPDEIEDNITKHFALFGQTDIGEEE